MRGGICQPGTVMHTPFSHEASSGGVLRSVAGLVLDAVRRVAHLVLGAAGGVLDLVGRAADRVLHVARQAVARVVRLVRRMAHLRSISLSTNVLA